MGDRIEVRIRTEEKAVAAPLCSVEWTDLEALRQEVSRWGIEVYDTGESLTDVTGNFALEDGEAYFELIVVSSEAP